MQARLEKLGSRMRAASTLDGAVALLRETGEVIGMELPAVIDDIAGNVPASDPEGRRLNEVLGWPAWMIDGWYGRAYPRQHPIYLRCRFENMPFGVRNDAMWESLGTLTAAQQHMRRDMETVGLYGSIAVPVHLALSRTAAIMWATRTPRDIDGIIGACGHLLLAIAHGFMAVMHPPHPPRVAAGDLSHLTDRQIDCLYWLASGKTIAETATILDISAHTVREHLRAVTARLNAVNTTHAVALAAQFGIIGPLR